MTTSSPRTQAGQALFDRLDGTMTLGGLREAARRLLAAEDAHRDAINGQGHPGEEHDTVLGDLNDPDRMIVDTVGDCSRCGGAQYGSDDGLNRAYGDIRQALGLPRMAWEGEDDPALAASPSAAHGRWSHGPNLTEADHCPDCAASRLPDRVVVGDNGAYWRDYGDHYSMPPVSEDNEPVEVIAAYIRLQGKPLAIEQAMTAPTSGTTPRTAAGRDYVAWDIDPGDENDAAMEARLGRHWTTEQAIIAIEAEATPAGGLREALERLLEASDPDPMDHASNWTIGPGNSFTEARQQARALLARLAGPEEEADKGGRPNAYDLFGTGESEVTDSQPADWHERRPVEGSDCCCCFKARFQPWHGSRCPHGLGRQP